MQWQLRSLLVSHGRYARLLHKLWLLGGYDVVVTLVLEPEMTKEQLIEVEMNGFFEGVIMYEVGCSVLVLGLGLRLGLALIIPRYIELVGSGVVLFSFPILAVPLP